MKKGQKLTGWPEKQAQNMNKLKAFVKVGTTATRFTLLRGECVVLSEYLGAFAQVVADLDIAVMS